MRSLHSRCLLFAGTAILFLGAAFGQEKTAAPNKPLLRRLTVSVGRTLRVQMTGKRPIKAVFNENETIVRVAPVPGDPTTLLITGLRPGIARIHLTDVDGKEEILGPAKR